MKQLNKSEIKELNAKLKDMYNVDDFFSKKEKITIDGKLLFREGETAFFDHQGKWIPALKLLLKQMLLKKITVDMGAVRFMASGADVMRPGVVGIDEGILKGDIVVVVDENHGKPLCVAEAMFDSEEMNSKEGGKIAKNIHYIGDEIWNS